MSDIDFDELDRAVNPVMKPSDNAKPEEQPEDETGSFSNDASEDITSDTETVVEQRSESEATEESVVQEEPAASIAKRKQGMYMDMVQSGNRKQKPQSLLSKRKAAAELASGMNAANGPSISDIAPHPNLPQSQNTTESDNSEVDTTTSAPDNDMQKKLEAALAGHIEPTDEGSLSPEMDTQDEITTLDNQPADVKSEEQAESSVDTLNEPVVSTETDDENTDESIPETVESESTSKPESVGKDIVDTNSSPFLADAKVEKRPLNSESLANDSESSEYIASPLSSDAKQKPASEDDKSSTELLPKELQQDILAIEGHSTVASGAASNKVANNESEEKADQSKTALSSSSSSSLAVDTKSVAKTSRANIHSTSITQQYKIKQSTSETSHAPIYDTNTHPLAHPPKKKSGWGTVIFVVIMILIGAGGATALYYSGWL